MDKCRADFETFWTARCCGLGIECVLTRLTNGDYYDIKAYYAWIGWKESRESMKAIKLPKHSNPLKNKTMMFISEVKILLESAGINVEIDE